MVDDGRPGVVEVARWAGRSQRLRQRRFTLLPLRGPGAVFTDAQGRAPSSTSTAPAELVELISSIAEVGVLQPVLVEETPQPSGPSQRRVVAGHRRLRAVLWGAVHLATNPHFEALPAVVCPGPLSEEEVRVWQLVENLAREDLQPGELAAALLFERCALLAQRIADAGVTLDDSIWSLDDPIQRWDALEAVRSRNAPTLGAPWREVLSRIGIQMNEDRAKRLVRAFRALPAELSDDMDAQAVALATRLDYLRLLDRGRQAAATEIWAAIKGLGRPQLLGAAVREAETDTNLDPGAAVERAQALHEAANEARRVAQQPRPDREPDGAVAADQDPDGDLDISELLAAQRALLIELRAGHRPSRYDTGSLRLGATEILEILDDLEVTRELEPPGDVQVDAGTEAAA